MQGPGPGEGGPAQPDPQSGRDPQKEKRSLRGTAVQMSSAARPRTSASGHTAPRCAELGVPQADWETSRALRPLSSCWEGENIPSTRTLPGVSLTTAGGVVQVPARATPVVSSRVPPRHSRGDAQAKHRPACGCAVCILAPRPGPPARVSPVEGVPWMSVA